jgi:hypothetical protein
MPINLIMRPEVEPMAWDDFRVPERRYSIALDGFVKEGPRYDADGPWLNLNHHEEVERLATRATCAQALMSVRMGLYRRFFVDGEPHADVWANDCDEDVCSSWLVLSKPHLTSQAMNPVLNRLIGVVDAMDSTAGAYPFRPDLPALQELAWIFQPYRAFRANGGIDRRDASEFTAIVTDVGHRMMEHVCGRGGKIPLNVSYSKRGGGTGWMMFTEDGENGRLGAFRDGVTAYVICRERSDGRMAYTVGRVSQFIPFDVPRLLAALSAAEGATWGGGNTIGGSPRAGGSRLTPAEVEKIINGLL